MQISSMERFQIWTKILQTKVTLFLFFVSILPSTLSCLSLLFNIIPPLTFIVTCFRIPKERVKEYSAHETKTNNFERHPPKSSKGVKFKDKNRNRINIWITSFQALLVAVLFIFKNNFKRQLNLFRTFPKYTKNSRGDLETAFKVESSLKNIQGFMDHNLWLNLKMDLL